MTDGAASPPRSFRSLGFAPLYRVEQELLRYEGGEVAHIENVLKGERRSRDHRRLKRTEETVTVEAETIEETERDLQSTDRFELQKESQESQKQESSLEVGVNLKYGGFVDVEASTRYSQTDASERSDRTARSYAREITERTTSRIRERVREERVRTVVEEFEEKNLHTVDNIGGDAEHVVGIYRWVDKLYLAQLFDYGWRLLFEFVVPEPAAFLRYADEQHPAEGEALVKPEPPTGVKSSSTGTHQAPPADGPLPKLPLEPLRPGHLEPGNYQDWMAEYGVTGVKAPPPRYRIIAVSMKSQEQPQGNQDVREVHEKKVAIPAGYGAYWAHITVLVSPSDNVSMTAAYRGSSKVAHEFYEAGGGGIFDRHVGLTIGMGHRRYFPGGANYEHLNLNMENGELAIGVEATHRTSWVATIELVLLCTDDALDPWRQETYNAIMDRYLELKAEYEEALAARGAAQGVTISGRSPGLNRELEKRELKRGALTLLTERWHPQLADFGSVRKDGLPEIDFDSARDEAEEIQFLEQAFEWSYMMYSLYPYYWTDRLSWPGLTQIEDNDPLHADFLQAGAARVIVPVRPGYESWIVKYLTTGQPYDGQGPPQAVAGEFVDIYEEIREKQAYDGKDRDATLTVTGGSHTARASKPVFELPTDENRKTGEHDVGRRIHIAMQPYRIVSVSGDKTEVTLAEPYQEAGLAAGATRQNVPFAIGARYVGAPWLVRVPTSLVILEKTDQLSGLTFGKP